MEYIRKVYKTMGNITITTFTEDLANKKNTCMKIITPNIDSIAIPVGTNNLCQFVHKLIDFFQHLLLKIKKFINAEI